MESKVWKIVSLILAIIVIVLAVVLAYDKLPSNDENTNDTEVESKVDDKFKMIRVNEDFDTDKTIEGLENVRWHNARIEQMDKKMNVSIMIDNESEKDKVPAKTLTVKLMDKQGKQIVTKDVEMKEIPAKNGYTTLDLEFELKDYVVVYDIQIDVKK